MENEEQIGLETKPKKLKLLSILLVILFAAIIGAGSWFYVDAGRKEKQAEEDKVVQEATGSSQSTTTDSGTTSSATNSPTTATTDETKDWKTYENTEYGLSLKYPTNWTATTNNNNSVGALFAWSVDDGDMYDGVSLTVYTEGTDAMKNSTKERASSTVRKTINNVEWTIYNIPADNIEHTPSMIVYTTTKSGKTYWLYGQEVAGKEKINQIMNTFQIDTTTADWKTYNNTTYGYSIKYPKDWVLDSTKLTEVTLNSPENIQVENDIKAGKYYGEGYMKDITVSYFENIAAADGNNPKKWNNFSDMVNDKIMFGGLKETTLAGAKAYEATEGGFSAYYVVLTEKDGHIYKILFGNKESASKITNTDKAFLSSFQFTR